MAGRPDRLRFPAVGYRRLNTDLRAGPNFPERNVQYTPFLTSCHAFGLVQAIWKIVSFDFLKIFLSDN
jgi:hypothetical protein